VNAACVGGLLAVVGAGFFIFAIFSSSATADQTWFSAIVVVIGFLIWLAGRALLYILAG